MSKGRFRKAKPAERDAYSGIYPLAGFLKMGDFECAVELLNDKANGLKYEVMAPDGYHFNDGIDTANCSCALHTLLCADANERDTRPVECGLTRCGGYGTRY